jgi:antitoxin (DNA-binding transcriptional repressor) of toxin-antitoxin stability system
MLTVNMLDAKTNLSKLVERLESEEGLEVIIARNGKPAAKLVRFAPKALSKRIGIANGRFKVPDSIDADNEEIAGLFNHGKP